MLEKILSWFRSNEDIHTVGENESFVLLMRAAQEDSDFSKKVCTVLAMPEFHRKSAINSMVDNMKLNGISPNIVSAIASLIDNKVAEDALKLLQESK